MVMPSKEDIAKGYQGSKEAFLEHRAEGQKLVANETEDVHFEVLEHEMQRVVDQVLKEDDPTTPGRKATSATDSNTTVVPEEEEGPKKDSGSADGKGEKTTTSASHGKETNSKFADNNAANKAP